MIPTNQIPITVNSPMIISSSVPCCFFFKNSDETSEQAPIYKNFDSALSEITKLSSDQRLIFVIDEYPYLAKADKSISSRLQHIIDHTWQSGRLFLILCGSSMSFMEYQVLGYESPLYGRRTAQFKIEALNYKEIAAFCPTLSPEQLSLVYGITRFSKTFLTPLRTYLRNPKICSSKSCASPRCTIR